MSVEAQAVRARHTSVPRRRMGERTSRLLASLACVLGGVVFLLPLAWVASLSIRDQSDVISLRLLPSSFRPRNYLDAIDQFGLGGLFAHSVLVTGGTVVLSVALSVTAAFAMARWRTRLTEGLFLLILLGLMVPPAAIIVPFFAAMLNLGLYNSLLGVILGESAFALPIALLMLRGYVERVPAELMDAARIDGASPWRAFRHVMVPLLKPAIVTVALSITLFTWNDLLLPLVLFASSSSSTLTVGLASSVGQYGQLQLGLLAAASLLAALPLLAVFMAARRYYVLGLTAGALKQ